MEPQAVKAIFIDQRTIELVAYDKSSGSYLRVTNYGQCYVGISDGTVYVGNLHHDDIEIVRDPNLYGAVTIERQMPAVAENEVLASNLFDIQSQPDGRLHYTGIFPGGNRDRLELQGATGIPVVYVFDEQNQLESIAKQYSPEHVVTHVVDATEIIPGWRVAEQHGDLVLSSAEAADEAMFSEQGLRDAIKFVREHQWEEQLEQATTRQASEPLGTAAKTSVVSAVVVLIAIGAIVHRKLSRQ